MTITELRKKRASVWETAKNFLNSQRQENGLLSAEDDATYSRMEKEITDLGAEIARLERQESIEAELSKPVSQPITGQPMTLTFEVDAYSDRSTYLLQMKQAYDFKYFRRWYVVYYSTVLECCNL